MKEITSILKSHFDDAIISIQETKDKFPTLWINDKNIIEVLRFLKNEVDLPYKMLYDLTAIDEQTRKFRQGQPESRFTIVYQLLSFERNDFLRLKVPLTSSEPLLQTATSVWSSANWYEREIYDLFGVKFTGHPDLRRILMPQTWKGHPLQKCQPARATEMGPFELPDDKQDENRMHCSLNPKNGGLKNIWMVMNLCFSTWVHNIRVLMVFSVLSFNWTVNRS